jgi:hypothetical protein
MKSSFSLVPMTFLKNHREVIVAVDFFTVPTITILLYCLFVIHRGRRKVLHFNVTRHPAAEWPWQPLREVFSDAGGYRYVILDHDTKLDAGVNPAHRWSSSAVRPTRMA